ncbi:S9 family peptidase [soil metagenome]
MPAPAPKFISHTWNRPSGPVEDKFAWLRDRDDPDTRAYLEAENAHADEWFAAHADTVETVFNEIRSRVQEADLSPPVHHRGWWYVTRTEENKAYPSHCRGNSPETATDTVLLDQNVEADGHEYFDLALFELSADHRHAAWSCDTSGDEHYTLRIRDLERGTDLDDEITHTTWAGAAWSADGRYVFYVTADSQERPCHVWRHEVGTPQSDDVRIYSEDDERFFVGISNSRSDEWIMIHAGSKTCSEQWMLRADDPTADPQVARLRDDDVEYQIDHWGDRFVVLTNLDSIDFRVMAAPIDRPDEWTELVPDRPGHRVTSIEPFADHLVVHEWVNAQPRVRVLFRDGRHELIDLSECEGTPDRPEPHDLELGTNAEWSTSQLRVMYQSLATPMTIIDVDVVSGEQVVVKRMPTPNVHLDRYVAEREWVDTDDGARVPVDIIRHVDTPIDGTARCVLYGYGSYEASLPPWFSIARLSYLDRGGVWALVHPRGGGELGRQWYLDGKLLNKKRTFTDTLAAADHLVARGWSASDRLAIRGGSAGGLLVGACVTMRPERFAAAVAEVPFVDIVSTMSDPTLPLTVTEWEEWGDPRAEPYASYMQSYSPYDNTVAADYPALYVTAGLNDPRVSYHEPAKWVAKLRNVRTNDAPLLLRTEMGAGHAGPSGRYDSWRDEARVLTFLLATT